MTISLFQPFRLSAWAHLDRRHKQKQIEHVYIIILEPVCSVCINAKKKPNIKDSQKTIIFLSYNGVGHNLDNFIEEAGEDHLCCGSGCLTVVKHEDNVG